MKKAAKFDPEKLEILQAWEAGALKQVADSAQQTMEHRAAADATFKKDQRLKMRGFLVTAKNDGSGRE